MFVYAYDSFVYVCVMHVCVMCYNYYIYDNVCM